MPKTVFKNHIAFYMEQHHMGDTETANRIGVSRNTLYRLKTRDLARMDAKTVKAILDLFRLPFDTMFDIVEVDD